MLATPMSDSLSSTGDLGASIKDDSFSRARIHGVSKSVSSHCMDSVSILSHRGQRGKPSVMPRNRFGLNPVAMGFICSWRNPQRWWHFIEEIKARKTGPFASRLDGSFHAQFAVVGSDIWPHRWGFLMKIRSRILRHFPYE